MTDAIDAFHAAIFADLADPLPRLVYADWLEERGEADYAELVRLFAAGLRLPSGRNRPAGHRRRQTELYAKLLRDWRLRELFGYTRLALAHGVLPDELPVDTSELARSDEWPVYLRPRKLWVCARPADQDGLGWHVGLRSAVELRVDADGLWPAPAGAVLRSLADSPYLTAVRTLDLSDLDPTSDELTAFAGSELATRLRAVVLSVPDGLTQPDEYGERWPRCRRVTVSGDVPAGLRLRASGAA